MEYASLFYMISIMDNLRSYTHGLEGIFGAICFCFGLTWVICIFWYNCEYGAAFSEAKNHYNSPEEVEKNILLPPNVTLFRNSARRGFITFLVLSIAVSGIGFLLPTKKDAMLIVAGIGVVEATKSDSVKKVASKSAQIVENWLDKQLAETGQEAGKAVKQAAEEVKDAGKKAVTDASKELANKVAK